MPPWKAALSILFAIGDGDQYLLTDPNIDDRALILYICHPQNLPPCQPRNRRARETSCYFSGSAIHIQRKEKSKDRMVTIWPAETPLWCCLIQSHIPGKMVSSAVLLNRSISY